MILRDLVSNGIVKDTDRITIAKPLCACVADIRKGNWFQDQILEFMNTEIKALT